MWRLGWWRDARNRSDRGRQATVVMFIYTALDWLEGGDKGGAVNRNELNQVALTGVGIS